MSRIHEALRRAEQETKSSGSAEPDSVTNVVEHVPLPELPTLRAEPAALRTESVETRLGSTETFANFTSPSGAAPEIEQWLENIPRKQWNPNLGKLLFADPNHHYEPGMEQFRTLRSRLYQMRDKMHLKTIMISSAVPGEGKSFVASNLAYVLVRQRGRRVLLIDGDVRKPHMHEFIGTYGTPGLNDYLAGDADERAIIQRGPQDNLYFIAGGSLVSNPAELIANGRFRQLLEQVSPYFHWILVDSPPVVPIADGSMMARCVDGVLLVVRAGSTTPEVVQRAKQDLKAAPILGVVLNRTEESKKLSSYYYSYSGVVPKEKGK